MYNIHTHYEVIDEMNLAAICHQSCYQLLMIVSKLYIISPCPVYLVTGSWCLLIPFLYFAHLPTPVSSGNHQVVHHITSLFLVHFISFFF